MKIIFGLGNPGAKYAATRHNIGYFVLDVLLERHSLVKKEKKCESLLAYIRVRDEEILLVKPLTFMNHSGNAVRKVFSRFELQDPLSSALVVLDDCELALGTIRLRTQGGSGGHLGLKSILECVGSETLPRLRIGIGRPADPSAELADFVLLPFADDERPALGAVLDRAADACEHWLMRGAKETMQRFNE